VDHVCFILDVSRNHFFNHFDILDEETNKKNSLGNISSKISLCRMKKREGDSHAVLSTLVVEAIRLTSLTIPPPTQPLSPNH
jgi:hypothetical protein